MKIRIIHYRQILLTVIIIICYQSVAFSQESDSILVKPTGLFFGLSLGAIQSQITPSSTQLINVGYSSFSKLSLTKQYSYFGSIEIGYFFSKFIGLSTGIGYNSYSTQLQLASYLSKLNSIDSENEAYELRVSGKSIKEDQQVSFLTIPICFNLRLPLGRSFDFFLEPGINLAIPLGKSYQSSGTFTYKGYYPAYNVLLENLPAYGFPKDLNTEFDGKLSLKPFNFSAVVSAGFDFQVQNKYLFGLAVYYDRSLTSIADYSSPDSFQLSSEVNQINSMMGGSSKTTIQSIGIKIVFRYYLKYKKV
jgi:hypothetical protein